MSAYKNDNFNDRLATAANARKAALEKFRARPGPDDPAVLERQAARKAVAVAREACRRLGGRPQARRGCGGSREPGGGRREPLAR